MRVGDKVKFADERRRYTVQACNDRFAICTKPFNLLRTVRYTIIDWARGIRGTENLVFGFGAETRAQCEAMLARLTSGETEISSRNWVPLDIEGWAVWVMRCRACGVRSVNVAPATAEPPFECSVCREMTVYVDTARAAWVRRQEREAARAD